MSILTDRQIRIRCEADVKKITALRDFGPHLKDKVIYHLDPLYVKNHYQAYNDVSHPDERVFHIEDAPANEFTFSPMIAPFHREQIRAIQRDPTPEERRIFSPHEMLTAEEQIAALRKLSPSANGVSYKEVSHPSESPLQIDQKVISSGLSSMGYDVTLARDFKIFTNVNSQIIDPLNMSDRIYHEAIDQDYCIIPPNSYILGHTVEWFDIPKNILALCLGKSTYARCGAIVNATPIEPGFKGRVVIEISNATNLPLKVYAGQGVAQFLFLQATEDCEVGYGDRDGGKGGKYQGQAGLQTALV